MIKRTVIALTAIVTLLCMLASAACGGNKSGSNALNTQPPQSTQSGGDGAQNQKDNEGGSPVKVTIAPSAPSSTTPPDGGHVLAPNGESTYTVKSEDGFYSYGFTCFKTGRETDYKVEINDANGKVEWSIYLLDEEFPESERYLPQAYEPVMTESGSMHVAAGQFVYVQCSVCSYNAETPVTGGSVTFTGTGLPKN